MLGVIPKMTLKKQKRQLAWALNEPLTPTSLKCQWILQSGGRARAVFCFWLNGASLDNFFLEEMAINVRVS